MWLLHFINNTAVFLFAKCERCQQESMGEISSSSGIIICFFLYQLYIVKCFVVLNEVCAPAFGHLNTVTSLSIK